MQYTFQYFIGAGTVKVELGTGGVATFGPVTLSYRSMIAMGISVVMIAVVGYALLRTRIGRATRAVSDNPALAAASGIDVDKVIRLVWTVAAALAGLSGLLYALVISNGIRWDTGLQILLLLFAAVTLGGLGTAFGALVGSLIIGSGGGAGGAVGGAGGSEVCGGVGDVDRVVDGQAAGSARSCRTSRLRRPEREWRDDDDRRIRVGRWRRRSRWRSRRAGWSIRCGTRFWSRWRRSWCCWCWSSSVVAVADVDHQRDVAGGGRRRRRRGWRSR